MHIFPLITQVSKSVIPSHLNGIEISFTPLVKYRPIRFLILQPNQKPYAGTSMLYKETQLSCSHGTSSSFELCENLLATDQGFNCLVPKPALHLKLQVIVSFLCIYKLKKITISRQTRERSIFISIKVRDSEDGSNSVVLWRIS